MAANPRLGLPALVGEFFGSTRFGSALTLAAVGAAFCTNLIRSTIGWPGLFGVLGTLVVLAAISFVAYHKYIEWHGLLPISILVFVGWCAASIIWSNNSWATLGGVAYQLAFAFLAVYIALVRDTIQVVRVVGNVLRVLLATSLALEILSGLLIDMPITFLGIQGNLAAGGPIQGIFGTRNLLGFVAMIAFVTFLVELVTRSVRRETAIGSILLAVLCLVLSNSPTITAQIAAVAVATIALFVVRRVRAERRRILQLVLLALTVTVLVVAYLIRTHIIDFLNARTEFQTRYTLWLQIWDMIPIHPLNGWGWVGTWRGNLVPYSWINYSAHQLHSNALNSFLDVGLQVGLIGMIAFIGLIGLALGRSWLLASNKHSVIYTWSPLVLMVLVVTSMFESSTLVNFGWLLLVVCAVKASQGMSWRGRLAPRPSQSTAR